MPSEENGHRLSVERIYQKKTQLEHILLRPDTYIGSVEPLTQPMWVYDGEEQGMVYRDITYVPGLYKIFDEILVNAADHKQRDKKMDSIKIEIDSDTNKISVYNNGKGIDVAMHKVEKVYVPTLIFGHLLTGANFDDDEKKVVGGRNGYGAKLCNIFSTKFTIETSSKRDNKYFKQTWTSNMSKAGEPIIKEAAKEDFTRVTFYPDLSKFGMQELDRDTVALFSRRAYDIAGSTKGVKVYLNGSAIRIKSFKDYVDCYLKGKEDEQGNPLKCAFESCSERWEIAIALSESGFRQISFVNSIATTKGGRHVDHVTQQILDKLVEAVKKKNKAGVQVKPFQLKNNLWVFVNCLIENPAFDSQTKENLNTQVNKFGSKCTPTEKFFTAALKTGIVEAALNWIRFKADSLKDKACSKTKYSKLKGIPKLEDANDAGTKNSIDCTLIVTEGDSAKSLVVAGLGVIGRDKYGVFPLKGKILNVREASSKQISDNAEITNILKIMGLQYKKKYETVEDLKTLRYGKLMIMTDQDQDGSHIKGLLINFIHHNWPSLLKMPFLEEFITPIVKVSKGHQVHSFYSLPEFEEWKKGTNDWNKWKVKYYKGLGTSTSVEAKEYFSDLGRHRIRFKYEGPEDDNSINLAFSKKMIEGRKRWLESSMESRKMRRELGLSEVYLYGKDTKVVSYQDFVNKELVLFSNLDNERSIPSIMDGLKPGQRKVLFTCFKRNDKKEVKVAQLAGSVGEVSAYHHGEASLMQTIIGLAQNFVGSNNINLLEPRGQFGTRLQGGKDHASPRYIFTLLSPLTRKLFHLDDDPLLDYQYDDNLRVEPEYYVPILPMVLVNGAEGIGTGWSTKIPNYNPRDIVRNLRKLMENPEMVPDPMKPWFKGFRGEIDQVETSRFVVNGEVAELESNKIEITELPIRTWTQSYKESVMEVMATGTDKVPQFITDYKEHHTDTTVRFVVTLPESNLRKAESEGIHKTFKLQTTFTTTSMVLFDSKGCLKRYENAEEILREFYNVRLDFYNRRWTYMLGKLEAECEKLKNQARFIQEKIEGVIKLENKKKKSFIAILEERGYASDPVKKWKIDNSIIEEKKKKSDEEEEEENDSQVGSDNETTEEKDYDYLMDMPMRSMLLEKKDELLRKRDQKIEEHKKLSSTTIQELWLKDLDEFEEELARVEAKEKAEQESGLKFSAKGTLKISAKGKGRSTGNQKIAEDALPSKDGQRFVPKIDYAGYAKNEEKTKAKKEGKSRSKTPKKNKSSDVSGSDTEGDFYDSPGKRKSMTDEEDNDDTVILEQNGTPSKKKNGTVKAKEKKEPKEKKPRGPKKETNGKKASSKTIDSYFNKTNKKQKKSASSSESEFDVGDDDELVTIIDRPQREKRETKKITYDFDADSDISDSEIIPKPKDRKDETKKKTTVPIDVSDSDQEFIPKNKEESKKESPKYSFGSDDDSDEDFAPKKTEVKEKKPLAKKSFDSDSEGEFKAKKKAVVKEKKEPAKTKKKTKSIDFDDDSDDSFKLKKKVVKEIKKRETEKKKTKSTISFDSDSEDEILPKKKREEEKIEVKEVSKKQSEAKRVSGVFDSDSEDDDSLFARMKKKKKANDSDSDWKG